MKNINVGIANLIISNKLKDSCFSNTLIEESKKLTADFFNAVKSSPILQLELKVFNNMENKHIENDVIATRYIDNNIKLFEIYTIEEIEKERKKLNEFLDNEVKLTRENAILNPDKIELYEAIDTLIIESLNDYDKIDVDNVHESFSIVLNHIRKPKMLVESVDIEEVNEEVIEIAVDKFNEKYDSLNEDDKNLIKTLIKSNDTEKQAILESFKNENLKILENIAKENTKDSIVKAIQKIKEMKYNKNNVEDNIISLYELKKELL